MKVADVTDEMVAAACVISHRQPGLAPISLEVLTYFTSAPDKVASRAMERAARRGLIDFGVSLRTAWATPEGAKLAKDFLASFDRGQHSKGWL